MATEQKIIKTKVGVLELDKRLGKAAWACRIACRLVIAPPT